MNGSGLAGLRAQPEASFRIEVDIELSQSVIASVNREILSAKRGGSAETETKANYIHHPLLRYRVEIGIHPDTGLLFVLDEYLSALAKDGTPRSKPQPFIERKEDKIFLRMEGQSHPTYWDTRLDHTVASRPHYPPHYPHLTALKRELESWFFYYFEPRERMRASVAVKEVRHIGLMGENLSAYLHTLKTQDEPQFKAVEKSLRSIIPSISGIKTDVNKFGEVELSVMEGECEMPARVVSEGTLRIIGLLALLGVRDAPAVIGFEEPENGIQPRRISDIARILENSVIGGRTQMIVTTHSPLLPDYVEPSSLYMCQKVSGATEIKPFEPGELFKQPSIDSALDDQEPAMSISDRILRGDYA